MPTYYYMWMALSSLLITLIFYATLLPLFHKSFLDITATRYQHGLFLSQASYIHDILQRASMASCKPCTTPVDTPTKLSVIVGLPLPDGTLYRTLVGAL